MRVSFQESDSEIKKCYRTQTSNFTSSWVDRLSKFSDLTTAIRAVTTLRKACQHKSFIKAPQATIQDNEETKFLLFKWANKKVYLTTTKSRTAHYTKSPLRKLEPIIDKFGLVRVGGQLQSIELAYKETNPIILPRQSHITQLLVRYCHERTAHQGKNDTIAEIRASGYWIIGCTHLVNTCIHHCVKCRRQGRLTETQKMASLPVERTTPGSPFKYVGCDCFGPFYVKEGRKVQQRYGLIFTCMASRAVHLELLDDISTDTFINSLRCFIAMRGPIRQLRSDRGTNFIGAANEFHKVLTES